MMRWDIFCRVIDNYGDIAVSWRLARALAHAHGCSVRLWVDRLDSLASLVPGADVPAARQQLDGIEVLQWTDDLAVGDTGETADVVIEAFGCGLPPAYIERMATRTPRPRWIVLEYLSAEAWVGAHHRLPSPHPRLDVPRHFFFPGVAANTGGLLREADDEARHAAFDAAARRAWWRRHGYDEPAAGALTVSLFAYADAPYAELLAALACTAQPVVLALTAGYAADAVRAAAAPAQPAHVQLRWLPFLPQPEYDHLLWACDVNFVRGEDSFARAQWAATPFVWQPYAQAEGAHLTKLDAFLAAYVACTAPGESAVAQAMRALWHAWNQVPGAPPLASAWRDYLATLPAQRAAAGRWRGHLAGLGELAANLVEFVKNPI